MDTKSEYREKIRKWLDEKGCTPNEYETDDDSGFMFTYKDTELTAGFRKVDTDSIVIAWKTVFDEEGQKLTKYVKTSDILEMKKLLCHLHLQHNFKRKEKSIKEVYISKEIFFDGLTKDRIYEIIYDLYNAISLIREIFLSYGESTSRN